MDLARGSAIQNGGDRYSESFGDRLLNIENLTGSAYADRLSGDGGANVLNGGAGIDTLVGRGGNDTYYVDAAGDLIAEAAGTAGGVDTVFVSAANYRLKAGVAVEVLGAANPSSSAALYLAGNEFGQAINGSRGTNILTGGGGNDVLAGGVGNDSFFFNAALNATTNVDVIRDFGNAINNNDTIRLEDAVFTGLAAGTALVLGDTFAANDSATANAGNTRAQIIYETDTGKLFFDSNGSEAGGATQFATILNFASLTGNQALSAADFLVV